MEMTIFDLRKAVNERNRASEMALHYAAAILTDFRGLTPMGRKLMLDILLKIILEERTESRAAH